MANSKWEEQFKGFMRRAGEDLKRVGEDIRGEAQRLVVEMKDPDRQQRMKAGLREFSHWAKKTAEDVADLVEKGAQKAEAAFKSVGEAEQGAAGSGTTPPTASRPEPARRTTTRAPARKATAKKKAPAKKTGPARKKPAGAATRKTVGRKPRA
jgi:hypothetical protein